jgi:hypothetical protein
MPLEIVTLADEAARMGIDASFLPSDNFPLWLVHCDEKRVCAAMPADEEGELPANLAGVSELLLASSIASVAATELGISEERFMRAYSVALKWTNPRAGHWQCPWCNGNTKDMLDIDPSTPRRRHLQAVK